MNIQRISGLVVAMIALGVFAGHTAEVKRRQLAQAFMRQKLFYTQNITEGLALEKFELVSKGALRLREMRQSDHWMLPNLVNSPEFREHATNFFKSVDALFLASADKNLKKATEAYQNVVANCVDCHQSFRKEQRAKQRTN